MKMSRRQVIAAGIAIAAMPKPTFAADVQVFGRPVPELAALDSAMRELSLRYSIPAGAIALTYRGRLVLSRSCTGTSPLSTAREPSVRCKVLKPSSVCTCSAPMAINWRITARSCCSL